MQAIKKKILVTCCVMVLTVVSFVFGTIAYFTDTKVTRLGSISTGFSEVEIIDVTYPYGSNIPVQPDAAIKILPGYEISKTVTARNKGTLSLYVRVKLESSITLAENARGRENEIDTSLVSYDINNEYWVFHEGYYYYTIPLESGTEATPLFTKVIFDEEMGNLYKDSTIRFNVRMETVQVNNNSTNVTEAYGWSTFDVQGGGN